MTHQLRPRQLKKKVDDNNSLRNVYKSVSERAAYIGKQISNLIDRSLDANPHVEQQILERFGKPLLPDDKAFSEWLADLRRNVASLLQRNKLPDMPDICLTEQIHNRRCNTVVRGHMLHYWAKLTGDVAADAALWLVDGAPAAIAIQPDLENVCPQVEDDSECELDAVDLDTNYDNFRNYQGVEDNEEAIRAIEGYREKGYLEQYDTLEDLKEAVGGNPVLSKLGCIVKEKRNLDTGQVTKKTRIILDCKESKVSRVATRKFKAVLPRATDAVQSALQMLAGVTGDANLTLFIADVVDAFWLIPLHPQERKYFVAMLAGKYYVFQRTAQGSRAAPLTFSVIIALAGRFVQSLVMGSAPSKHGLPEAMLQIYVDDPLAIMRGTEARVRRLCCLIALGWQLMGFPLAFHKAAVGASLTWIGVKINTRADGVSVEVPQEKVDELRVLLQEVLKSNVVSIKNLRTLIGKVMAIATVLYMWRPYIHELYAALYSKQTHAPAGCVWVKQIQQPIKWLLTFLQGEQGSIFRMFSLAHYLGIGPRVMITWDASPYGMGATLQINDGYVEFFAIPISTMDEEILETKSGSSNGQQVWEALTGLIALRLWAKHWQGQRASLRLRGDNVGSLTMFATLKSTSKAISLIAREYSQDLGHAEYSPDIIQHLPGIANQVTDALSRRFDPNKDFTLPKVLYKAKAVTPPPRERDWWRTLQPPAPPAQPRAVKRVAQHDLGASNHKSSRT